MSDKMKNKNNEYGSMADSNYQIVLQIIKERMRYI